MADAYPLRVLRCLGLMLNGAREPWGAYGWKEEARPLLAFGLAHENREVSELAQQLVHRFGLLGHWDMRDLLETDGPPQTPTER